MRGKTIPDLKGYTCKGKENGRQFRYKRWKSNVSGAGATRKVEGGNVLEKSEGKLRSDLRIKGDMFLRRHLWILRN